MTFESKGVLDARDRLIRSSGDVRKPFPQAVADAKVGLSTYTTDMHHCTLHFFELMQFAKSCFGTSSGLCNQSVLAQEAIPMQHSSRLDLLWAIFRYFPVIQTCIPVAFQLDAHQLALTSN